MNAEEILAQAADLIEENGWCQGVGIDEYGRLCLGRALWDATGYPIEAQSIECLPWRLAVKAIEREITPLSIIGYNDASGRTQEEVVTALRNAKRWLQ